MRSRSLLANLAILALAASCTGDGLSGPGGGGPGNGDPGGADLSTVGVDLATKPSVDLSMPIGSSSGLTCLQVILCAQSCGSNLTCIASCISKGRSQAQVTSQLLFMCAYDECVVARDGGSPACVSTSDESAPCTSCVVKAGQSAACAMQLSACLSS
jgi:hypothetical protein